MKKLIGRQWTAMKKWTGMKKLIGRQWTGMKKWTGRQWKGNVNKPGWFSSLYLAINHWRRLGIGSRRLYRHSVWPSTDDIRNRYMHEIGSI